MPKQAPPDDKKEQEKALHGVSTEVTWDGGKGRQPYANQGETESHDPAAARETAEGNRGDASGRNKDQFDEVRKKK